MTTVDAARVELLLSELRLPGIKLMWAKLAEQSDKEGWPAARFLAAQGRDIRPEAYLYGEDIRRHPIVYCGGPLHGIHGGVGLATDLPIEKFWRDQRSMMITEGPIEILKMALTRHVLPTYG